MNKVNCYSNYTDSFQTSPSWVVTFVRFEERDFYNYSQDSESKKISRSMLEKKPPLVILNDCISLTVSQTKTSHNQSCSMALISGDTNYSASIAPGDYFIVNILNSEEAANSVYRRAISLKPINTYEDGFKGVFKVQSVHQNLQIMANGQKSLVYTITGHSFNEMDNVIYFNPYMMSAGEKDNDIYFLTSISDKWNTAIKDKTGNSVQNIIKSLYSAFIGNGFNPDIANKEFKTDGGLKRTENNLYKIPSQISKLLGVKKTETFAADIIDVYDGVQQYQKVRSNKEYEKLSPKLSKDSSGRFYTSDVKLSGHSYAKPEFWNQIKVWDIMSQYLNPIINEMYTTFKVSPNLSSGKAVVMPAFVIREKPFTTPNIKKVIKDNLKTHTYFHTLPNWLMPGEAVISAQIGRDDASRFNFVQVFGRVQMVNDQGNVAFQIGQGNYQVDRSDIIRSGLRPYVATSNFDYVDPTSKDSYDAVYWSKLIANWVMGSHLKMSGTINCVGIEKPIPIGDNMEYEGFLFHIEGITHQCNIAGNGRKTFRTSLQLSNGLNIKESKDVKPYAEMDHYTMDSYERKFQRKNENQSLLPGTSSDYDRPSKSKKAKPGKTKKE